MQRFVVVSFFVLLGGFAAFPDRLQAGQSPVISVVKKGAEKNMVSLAGLNASGPNGQLFVRTLTRDLELSGWFKVAPNGGSITVNGTVAEAGGGIQSGCRVTWPAKSFNWAKVSMGQTEVRLQAHQLADEMVRQIKGEKGIAQSRIVFVNRRGRNNADLYVCEADGQGMMQLTHDNVAAVGPRWSPSGRDIYYTSFLQGYPSITRLAVGGGRTTLASFRGLNTGAVVSPDGSRIALILSYQGNPELYVMNLGAAQLRRLTDTPYGAEASPCWSPDGRSIVYVSDISKTPQLYIVDVATRQSRRLTYRGMENVNPDWSSKGKIVYATKRGGGYQIAVIDPRAGEGSCELVTSAADYEHPSWAPDGRHVVCSSRSTLYILDTLGDPAVRLINMAGNWMSPDWSDR